MRILWLNWKYQRKWNSSAKSHKFQGKQSHHVIWISRKNTRKKIWSEKWRLIACTLREYSLLCKQDTNAQPSSSSMVFFLFICCLSSSRWFLMNNLWMFSVKYILRLAAVEMNATKVVFITPVNVRLATVSQFARACVSIECYCEWLCEADLNYNSKNFSASIAMAFSDIGASNGTSVIQALPYQSVRIQTIKDKLLHAFTSFSSKFVLFQSDLIYFEQISNNNAPVAHVENETREKFKRGRLNIVQLPKNVRVLMWARNKQKPPSNKSMLFLAAAKIFPQKGLSLGIHTLYSETKRDHE